MRLRMTFPLVRFSEQPLSSAYPESLPRGERGSGPKNAIRKSCFGPCRGEDPAVSRECAFTPTTLGVWLAQIINVKMKETAGQLPRFKVSSSCKGY